MAQSEGFYMTLPSDGSIQFFPDNKLSDYKTLLPNQMHLDDGEWEVALTEMMYDHSVRNLSPEEAYFDVLFPGTQVLFLGNPDPFNSGRFTLEKLYNVTMDQILPLVGWRDSYYQDNYKKEALDDKLMPDNKATMKIVRIKFRPGAYPSGKALVKEVNLGLKGAFSKIWQKTFEEAVWKGTEPADKTLPEEDFGIQLAYDKIYDRILYQVNGKNFRQVNLMCVRFPLSLAYKMGFNQKALFVKENAEVAKFLTADLLYGKAKQQRDELLGLGHSRWLNINYLAPNNIDLFENLKRMYVYCDIVEPQIVGSNALQLLRVIPVSTNDSEYNEDKQAKWEPVRAEYLKLSKKHFDTIGIHIRNNLGELYPFLRGKTVAKLHFRKAY